MCRRLLEKAKVAVEREEEAHARKVLSMRTGMAFVTTVAELEAALAEEAGRRRAPQRVPLKAHTGSRVVDRAAAAVLAEGEKQERR